MKVVRKYELSLEDNQVISTKAGAEMLSVHWQHQRPCVWILLDQEEKTDVYRQVKVRGTGFNIDFDLSKFQYVGTVFDDVPGFVWHVWMEK